MLGPSTLNTDIGTTAQTNKQTNKQAIIATNSSKIIDVVLLFIGTGKLEGIFFTLPGNVYQGILQ